MAKISPFFDIKKDSKGQGYMEASIRVAYRTIKCALSEGVAGRTDFAGQDF